MKKISLLFVFMLFAIHIIAQNNLIKGEYYIDTDPGLGNAFPLTFTNADSINLSLDINLPSNLSNGVHTIYFRVKDDSSIWSLPYSHIILVEGSVASTQLTNMEFFIDNDPGFGNGNPISFSNSNSIDIQRDLNLINITSGFHIIFFRVKDGNGIWSHTKSQPISVDGNGTVSLLTNMEYFIDTDPGQGNATPISFSDSAFIDINANLNLSNVSTGFHIIYFRVKDGNNIWSHTRSQSIVVESNGYGTLISDIEYFIDTDPGFGNGISIPLTPTDSIDNIFNEIMSNITEGYHTIYIRVKDNFNIWSIYQSYDFEIDSCARPGTPAKPMGDTAVCYNVPNYIYSIDTTSLAIDYDWRLIPSEAGTLTMNDTSVSINWSSTFTGDAKLSVRSHNDCEYSGYSDSLIIHVYPLPLTITTVYGSANFCPGEFASIGVNYGPGYSYQWLKNDSIIPNAISSVYYANNNGDYSVEVTSFEGCSDTSIISTIGTFSMPAAHISPASSTSFCYGNSVILNADTGSNISYLWYKNGAALPNDTLQSLTVTNPGSYKVQLSNTDGCVDESSPEIVTVNPLPIVNLFTMGNTVFCDGDSVSLQTNTNTGYSYVWFKDGNVLSGDTIFELIAYNSGVYSVEITNEFSCAATSATASVISNPIPTSTFSLANTACSQDTVNIAYTGSASAVAFLNWNFDGGIILNGSGTGPFEVKWDSAGYKDVSLEVSEIGCVSPLETNTTEIKTVMANISSANTSVCQGDSVLLYANTGANYTYQWYQGGLLMPSASGSSLAALQTGNYQVKVTDANIGCSQLSSAVGVTINPINFGIAFSASNTSFTQPPFNVTFSNQTPNMSDYQFDWDLGDGNTSNFYNPGHNYQYNGTYTVNLYAENASTGCRDTLSKVDYISCNGGAPNPCTILAAITPAGPITICGGDSVMLTANSGSGYTYQWAYNNMLLPNEDSIVLYAKNSGNYRVIVSDAVCSQTSPAFVLNHYPSIQPVIQATGSIQPCTTDSMNLSLLVGYNSYNWSNGATSPSIYVNTTGYYQVAVTDNYGCSMTSDPYIVSNSFLNPPELCIVGVDTANHNQLVWERQNSALIDSFYVYREGFISGQYDKIGAIPFTQTSLFVDVNSNPAIKAYRYKIAAVDTCGGLTLLGNYHKTIHLTINAGLNGSWNLIWDGYEGFAFNSYRIYRGTNANNMSLLTQLASTATSYTDLNPPTGTVYYQIEVIKTTGCYPDTVNAKANTNYNTSRSNTANNANMTPVYLSADFDADAQTGIWPIQVAFNDLSTGIPTSWHWNFGDGNSSIEQNPNHTYNNTGVYTVSLIACHGEICDTTVKTDYIEVLPNGLVEVGIEMSTKLYPNPNDGNFTLEINDKGSHELEVHVYNALGSEVYSEKFHSNGNTHKNLKLGELPMGVYFVHLNTNEKIVYRTKVIIQR